ncbi:MAG: glycosyltransferase [Deltaproteobacteria bacterium]|nr:glycosyltransferase [Deltaproteobacteria bacterium]
MDAAPRISIIIPAYNEEAYLPRLLESIEVARERYGAGRGAVEVIVADNGSTDGTAAVARSDRSGWGASPSIALRWPDGATTAMLRSGKAMRVRLS